MMMMMMMMMMINTYWMRLISLTETLIIPDITKTESNNCFIIHCFEENDDKRIIAAITIYFQTLKNVQMSDKPNFCRVAPGYFSL